MPKGLLYFHQGWDDIALCLPLINHYATKYTHLYVLCRSDAWNLVQFYIRGLRNVTGLYAPIEALNSKGIGVLEEMNVKIDVYELIGQLDSGRIDSYKNAHKVKQYTREQLFYEPYGLSKDVRVNAFSFFRDPSLEGVTYTKYINAEPYICVQDEPLSNKFTCVNTKLPILNLNTITSNMFFDTIRILQHAKEIHLVDSTWAILCYMMDAKYGLFHQIPIHVYCYEHKESMFSEPVRLENWTLHSAEESRANRDALETAIVSFATGSYVEQQAYLVESVYRHTPRVPVFPFQRFEDIQSPLHSDSPYAFKVYAIQTVRNLGYKIVIWCDSVLRLTKPIESLITKIEELGVYLQEDGWNVAQWANDRSLAYFGVSRDEMETVSAIYACFMAYNFTNPITSVFFERWKKACHDGIFRGKWKNDDKSESMDPRCKGHRHDQTCAEIISYLLKIPRGRLLLSPGKDTPERYFTTWRHL
jgi:hypothetical protein